MSRITVTDEAIGEIIARSGGYEEVERAGKWAKIANSLGLRKEQAAAVKARYEDMLRASAEADEREEEDEDEEYEVEDIIDSRTDERGNVEYLVKWKDAMGNEGDGDDDENENMTWEPREHLACPELLQQFEEKQRRLQLGDAAGQPLADGEAGGEEGDAAAVEANGAAGNDGAGAASKRKYGEVDGAEGEAWEGAGDAKSDGGASATDTWQRIVRLRKPEDEGGPLVFEVLTSDGAHVLLPNAELRAKAPLLLVEFYEQRLAFA